MLLPFLDKQLNGFKLKFDFWKYSTKISVIPGICRSDHIVIYLDENQVYINTW